jgi:hypothetical protein
MMLAVECGVNEIIREPFFGDVPFEYFDAEPFGCAIRNVY